MFKKCLLIVLAILALPCFLIGVLITTDISTDILARMQIKKEQETLINGYQPVLDYLKDYRKIYGEYPEKLDDTVLPKSKTFKKVKYGRTEKNTGYWLKVEPKRHSIHHYHTNKSDDGYKSYKGTGYIDGFMDNEYYYEINNNWHAVRYGL